VWFRCVRYTAETGQTSLDWGFAILLLPPLATGGATLVLFATGARSRRRTLSDAGISPAPVGTMQG
jgi:hypothetical protein